MAEPKKKEKASGTFGELVALQFKELNSNMANVTKRKIREFLALEHFTRMAEKGKK